MNHRTIYLATGTVALALGLLSSRSAVAHVSVAPALPASVARLSAGQPITMSFPPDGFLRATVSTGPSAARDVSESEAAASEASAASPVIHNKHDGDESTTPSSVSSLSSLDFKLSADSQESVLHLRHRDEGTRTTNVSVTVNGEPVTTKDLPRDDVRITTENRGTLDGATNDNTVTVEREVEIDIESNDDEDTDVDQDLDTGDNDIEDEEQDVGDIRHGTVKIDLRGLND